MYYSHPDSPTERICCFPQTSQAIKASSTSTSEKHDSSSPEFGACTVLSARPSIHRPFSPPEHIYSVVGSTSTDQMLDAQASQTMAPQQLHISHQSYMVPGNYHESGAGFKHIPPWANTLQLQPAFSPQSFPSPAYMGDTSASQYTYASTSFSSTPSPYSTSPSLEQCSSYVPWPPSPDYVQSDYGYVSPHGSFRHEGEVEESFCDKPYARLIYEALMQAPGHRMMLREIYDWFQRNTTKPCESGSNGWQNSIRHNLSMNQVCFVHLLQL